MEGSIMRRSTITLLSLLAVVCVVYASPAREAAHRQSFSQFEIQRQTEQTTISLQFAELQWTFLSLEDGAIEYAQIPDGRLLERENFPMIPVTGGMIRIPPHSGVSIEIVNAEYEVLSGMEYAAFIGNGGNGSPGVNRGAEDFWFPETIVETASPEIFHDFRVCDLAMYPIQVNTAREEVRVYRNLQFIVHFEGVDERNTLPEQPTRLSKTFLPWYRELLDWNDNELDEYVLYRGTVQVVMRDDDLLWEMLEPWLTWKRQKGWKLDFVTDITAHGFSSTAIRMELIRRYEQSEDKIDYIVIIGDDTGLFPVPSCYDLGSYGDQEYSLLAGEDDLPDVALGRISIENTDELTTYINKLLLYERNPDLEDTDWYNHGLVSVPHRAVRVGSVFALRYMRHAMLDAGYAEVDTAWDAPWGLGDVNNSILPIINEGVSFFAEMAYIGSWLNPLNTNTINHNPVVVSLGENTGNWSRGGYGITERWIRQGTPIEAGGAIGAIGNTGAGTSWNMLQSFMYGVTNSAFYKRNPALGDLLFGGEIELYNQFHVMDPTACRNHANWLDLMGDPLVWIYTDIPHEMNVDAPEQLEIGQNYYTITVTEENEPLEGAWVALYKVDDEEEVITRAETDLSGIALIEVPFRFAGDAVLTVTQPNFAPVQLEIPVTRAPERIGYQEIEIQDDGENGTIGNGNGIPEAGEVIGLVVTAENFGNLAVANVSLTVSSDHPWVLNIENTINYGDLAPRERSTGDSLILLEIAPQSQNAWIIPIQLEFSCDVAIFEDNYYLEIYAPQFILEEIHRLDTFAPGTEADISFVISNVGGSDAAASIGRLESLDPALIAEGESDFRAINVGENCESGLYHLSAPEMVMTGHLAAVRLILETEIGQVDTLYFSIPIGRRTATDPCGPDRYGYYAFDNTDQRYHQAPVFEWIEINPNAEDPDYDGVNLELNDLLAYEDIAVVVELPFPVQYYSEVYEEATVCSNGWLAMGSQADLADYDNWTIPSPGGPDAIIAPYWDDRVISPAGGVFTYYDEPNGRFIVEWSQACDMNFNIPCTFEVILYDQVDDHLTRTGDAEILFQYNQLNHVMGQAGRNPTATYWWTTGIESPDQTDGIQYANNNRPATGAQPMTAEMAILFTTNVQLASGSIEGYVHRFENEEPVIGATVRPAEFFVQAVTDDQGYYFIESMPVVVTELIVEARGFNPRIAQGIEIIENQINQIDFGPNGQFPGLTHPQIQIDPAEIHLELQQNDQATTAFTIGNDGNGELEFSVAYPYSDFLWEEMQTFEATQEESRNRGVTFHHNDFWVCGSYNADPGVNKLYRYNRNGNLLGIYDQPVVNHSSVGFQEITSDGEYLYGHDRGMIYQMEFTGNTVESVQSWLSPLNIAKTITYDPDNARIWISNPEEGVYAFNMQGEQVANFNINLNQRAMGCCPDDPHGYILYFLCDNEQNNNYIVRKMHPQTGHFRDVFEFESDFSPCGSDITNELNPFIWSVMTVFDRAGGDYIEVRSVSANYRWLEITPRNGIVESNEDQEIVLTVFTDNFPVGVYNPELIIRHNAFEQVFPLPLEITVLPAQTEHFEPVEPIGAPINLVIGEGYYNYEMMQAGDEIGIFDGDLCVAAEAVGDEFPLIIPIYESGVGWQGFDIGDTLRFRYWNAVEEREYEGDPDPILIWGEGELLLDYLDIWGRAEQELSFQRNYFELFGLFVIPDNPNPLVIFAGCPVVIIYADNGGICIPPGMNTIGNLVPYRGYSLFARENFTITIEGTLIDPDLGIPLYAGRWVWLPYPLPYPLPVELALENILDELEIVQDDAGRFFIPGLINTIGNMQPGTGYFTFVSQDVVLYYNWRQPHQVLVLTPEESGAENILMTKNPRPTGLPYVVLVKLDETLRAVNPAAVELYDGSLLVGKAEFQDNEEITPVVCWGGNSDYDLVGFTNGHPISAAVLDASGDPIPTELIGELVQFGVAPYANIELRGTSLPLEFSVGAGYPNPFNPSFIMPFTLPIKGEVSINIVNLVGQTVFSLKREYEAGAHQFYFNTAGVESEIASGLYFVTLEFHKQVHTQKMILMK